MPAPTKYQAHDGAIKALNWDGLRDTIWSAGTDGAIRMFPAHFFVSAPPAPPPPCLPSQHCLLPGLVVASAHMHHMPAQLGRLRLPRECRYCRASRQSSGNTQGDQHATPKPTHATPTPTHNGWHAVVANAHRTPRLLKLTRIRARGSRLARQLERTASDTRRARTRSSWRLFSTPSRLFWPPSRPAFCSPSLSSLPEPFFPPPTSPRSCLPTPSPRTPPVLSLPLHARSVKLLGMLYACGAQVAQR